MTDDCCIVYAVAPIDLRAFFNEHNSLNISFAVHRRMTTRPIPTNNGYCK